MRQTTRVNVPALGTPLPLAKPRWRAAWQNPVRPVNNRMFKGKIWVHSGGYPTKILPHVALYNDHTMEVYQVCIYLRLLSQGHPTFQLWNFGGQCLTKMTRFDPKLVVQVPQKNIQNHGNKALLNHYFWGGWYVRWGRLIWPMNGWFQFFLQKQIYENNTRFGYDACFVGFLTGGCIQGDGGNKGDFKDS